MGLSFTIAAGPRQRIHSLVRVPWDSRPYFTVSDSRRPFLSPPTTHRATVEVFDLACTWDRAQLIPIVLLLTSRHGPSRKHRLRHFLYCWVWILPVGTCLFAKALLSNSCLYLLIKNPLPSSGHCFVVCFAVATWQRVSTCYNIIFFQFS
jgi:hypothetical protein